MLRSGRVYTPSASPVKPTATHNPFHEDKILDGAAVRPVEPAALRKKQLILSGDIRNLDSNFQLATSRVQISLPQILTVFAKYDVPVSNDEAQTLKHEFEENNDTGLSYEAFVAELVQILRQTALNKGGNSRMHIKKIRLAQHIEKLSTMEARLELELRTLLGERLRVPWLTVRDAFRAVDPSHSGVLTKQAFARVCTSLEIPVSRALLNALVVAVVDSKQLQIPQSDQEMIDYNDFLMQFGSAFQHGDTNSVGHTLVYERVHRKEAPTTHAGSPFSPINHTLQSPGVSSALNSKGKKPVAASRPRPSYSMDPVFKEQLRIVVNQKIASHYSDVKKSLSAMDPAHEGFISADAFAQVLQTFHLVSSDEELQALIGYFDTTGDGSVIDYQAFFAEFGDTMQPSATNIKKSLFENSSLVFSGPNRDVKGANKNRMALSSPGNELKEAFSHLSDQIWRAIYVEFEMSDTKKTGVVTSAEMLRVLGKYLGDLPKNSFAVLFRACGSHVNQLMNYRTLVKSYRPEVMDAVQFFQQDVHSQTERTYDKSPTESLVMVWSIRVQRAQLTPSAWQNVKELIWAADIRRQGRLVAAEFTTIVRQRMQLTADQAAFLCFFYEDKHFVSDQVMIRYASFLTDYEDPGLEFEDGSQEPGKRRQNAPRAEGKGRPRPAPPAINANDPQFDKSGKEQFDEQLRAFLRVNTRSFEAKLLDHDPEKKGFLPLDIVEKLFQQLSDGRWKSALSKATSSYVFSKYVAQNQFYYRGFLLDLDPNVCLQTHSFAVHDDGDATDDEDGADGDNFPDGDMVPELDSYQAKELLRHHLSSSMSRQKAIYKLFLRMDPGKSGLLTYPEIRRVLEKIEIAVDEATAREWLGFYEQEDDEGNKIGQIKYLQLLHAHGGRDPDKLDGMSDISSNCSYYSAISISPRAVQRPYAAIRTPQPLVSRDHVAAANAVSNAIDKQRFNGLVMNGTITAGVAGAAAVERKIASQLEAMSKTKWKSLLKAFQQIDKEHRGSVTAGSFKKVMDQIGLQLDQEDLARLQLKYDIEQNGRMHYLEFMRAFTNGMGDNSYNSTGAGANNSMLPSLPGAALGSPRKTVVSSGLPESLRQGVKAKWKAMYSSFRTLDKQNRGRVSTAHFRQLLEWYALALSDELFLQLLRQFDHEEDGLVDYNKFMRACMG